MGKPLARGVLVLGAGAMSLKKGDLALAVPVLSEPEGDGGAGRTVCCCPIGGGRGVLLNVQVLGGYSWQLPPAQADWFAGR